LGNEGLEVFAIGLDCMGISQSFGRSPDRATMVAFCAMRWSTGSICSTPPRSTGPTTTRRLAAARRPQGWRRPHGSPTTRINRAVTITRRLVSLGDAGALVVSPRTVRR